LRQFAGGGFGGGGRGPQSARGRRPAPGQDLEHEVTIPFQLAVIGGDYRIAVPRPDGDTESIAVKIPPGIVDGKKLRLTGKGASGGGGPGDLYLKIRIAPHPHFKRVGDNLEVQLPISVTQAFLGDKIDVPTPYGDLTVTVAPGASSGKRLRIRGYGVPRGGGVKGDLFVEVQIRAPKTLNERAKQLLRELQDEAPPAPPAISW
jgi:DnaJ-class molecular chaperone